MQLFERAGVHVLVDGQYGSTGKGLLADWLAGQSQVQGILFDYNITNAGPNSGHTFYDQRGEKHVLKQLPSFAVSAYLRGYPAPTVILSAGAIIDPMVLYEEANCYPNLRILVHPMAAVVTDVDRHAEHSGTVAAVAGTRSGAGAALARKVLRDPKVVWCNSGESHRMPPNVKTEVRHIPYLSSRTMLEISQGYSLGLNSQFYPKVTSRNCNVAQGLADADLPPRSVAKTYMAIRTYPIRVGNVDGHSSGDWYPDQREVSWDSVGVAPELTTVTKRPRRIATFSVAQFLDACAANDPDWVFVNFLNYEGQYDEHFIGSVKGLRNGTNRRFGVIGGYGPKSDDVRVIDG
jgi:adenylosuccinate synthase